ncbi:hydantoinase B/oxoprolinase family protein [Imperialibacter roseus]|uniref:Hydantoinase B/oxoprolinase family protein n=1 Tax=Imperialibacter roseus TaxID=1324217 RepID=A0ABZ0IP25_9BACT|nr:hydantoinase B/oxoprolinase family protein [Imperialibacter roseus]WOK06219.1 hydantoinase B/oxoprolinase family protein [Imperialibacter roseus]
MNKKWKIWVDTGGTFTDCLAETPNGEIKRVKVLSSSKLRGKAVEQVAKNAFRADASFAVDKDILKGYKVRFLGKDLPHNAITGFDPINSIFTLTNSIPADLTLPCDFELDGGEEAPVLAARLITETALDHALPPMDMRLGTTRGTNALLEKKGAKTAWLVTKGLQDLIRIGTQQRPDIFALKIEKPEPLYSTVFEIDERVDAQGNVLLALNSGEVERIIEKIKEQGIQSVAVSFLNSFKNQAHELVALDLCKKAGLTYVSISSQLFPAIKLLPRAETAVADAYLNPILTSYLTGVSNKLSTDSSLKVMTSAGGLVSANDFHAKDSLLSGPAGGVVGAAEIARLCGQEHILTLDMGGTSTDVSRYSGKPDYRFECEVGQAKIASPSVAVETVAAGGGSICSFDGHKLRVGPESAGAQPGPACYGAGGPLTITDVNLLLGRVDEEKFGIPLQKRASAKRLEEQLSAIRDQTEEQAEANSLLEGYLQIANERMAEAIRNISTRKGYDPAEHALLAFGGAGGQHACAIAELLGMKKIIVPFDAGLLSAYGIGKAVEERMVTQQVLKPLDDLKHHFEMIVAKAADEATLMLRNEGIQSTQITFVAAYLRFSGQDAVIEIESEKYDGLYPAFKSKYEELFGHWVENRAIEVESIKVKVSALKISANGVARQVKAYAASSQKTKEITHQGKQLTAQLYDWELLLPGAKIEGPAILASNTSTTWVAPGWQVSIGDELNAILDLTQASSSSLNELHETVALELFTNRFRGIAEEMGALLMRTAFSVNIKERLDFSCALLDSNGELVVNAPHIPVHLGGLGLCVRKVLEVLPLSPGDVAVTNHPGFGGSHLPDITLIAPVFEGTKLLGYVANRAHHAELGGKRPSSMPPDAKNLAEEGVVISPMLLIQHGEARWSDIEKVLTAHSYPTRAVAENMADLNAALSSIKAGQNALLSLCRKEGAKKVLHYMQRLKDYSNEKLWSQLQRLPGNEFEAAEKLDDESPLKVKLQQANDKLTVDFTGSSKVHPGNLNATPAIVRSAVIYVLRLLISEDIPLNEGIMKQVEIILPEGLLNPPFPADSSQCPAVVGGNTEVSQRLVDTLIKTLKLSACSQGTMNNLLFGNKSFGYYETICGGTGAGPGFNGADAIHHHMTNTRITDPEIMEWRYPVQVEEFSIRKGSGGHGKWKGGDGIVRKLRFTEAVELTILTQHRVEAPYGMKGGNSGASGKQYVEKSTGEVIGLKGVDEMDLQAGDAIVIETPGGGGWGP